MSYRIVVMESSQTRDGRPIEELGYYSPARHDKPLHIDLAAVEAWVAKGAQPTDTVDRLIRQLRRNAASAAAASPTG